MQRSVRRLAFRVLGTLFTVSLAIPVIATAGAASPRRLSNFDARSGGAVMGAAYRSGGIRLASPASPAATLLGNVQASTIGSQPANETPIIANPARPGQVATAANDYNCSNLTGIYTSNDGGATFPNKHCGVAPPRQPNGGDPGLAYTSTGTLFASYLACNSLCSAGGLAYQSSPDNGVTWNPVGTIPASFTNGLSDKPWMEIDNFASSPFRDTIYISNTEFDSSFTKTRIAVAHSTDGGATWTRTFPSAAQSVPTVDQFTDLAVGKDGTVYLAWMRCTEGGSGICANRPATMLFSRSADGGNTWSAPVTIATVRLSAGGNFYGSVPGTSERLSDIPVIDVDNSSGLRAGALYVAMYTYSGGLARVLVASSTNGGTTWSSPVAVLPGQTQSTFFPWLSVSRTSGLVGVGYDYGNATVYLSRAAFSANGGASFVGNVNVASAGSAYVNDGFGGTFMGDYTGAGWGGRKFHVAWTDTRNGSSGQDMTGGVSF